MVVEQQAGPLVVLASLPTPGPGTARTRQSAHGEPMSADASWDETVRWFREQREWAELVATDAELNPDGAR